MSMSRSALESIIINAIYLEKAPQTPQSQNIEYCWNLIPGKLVKTLRKCLLENKRISLLVVSSFSSLAYNSRSIKPSSSSSANHLLQANFICCPCDGTSRTIESRNQPAPRPLPSCPITIFVTCLWRNEMEEFNKKIKISWWSKKSYLLKHAYITFNRYSIFFPRYSEFFPKHGMKTMWQTKDCFNSIKTGKRG